MWLCLGVTLWLLEGPDRLWPWFPVGWAVLGTLATTGVCEHWIEALGALLFAGAPLAYAGYRLEALGYAGLGWICWGVAAILAVNLTARGILALWQRNSSP